MKSLLKQKLFSWIPQLKRQVWILVAGRLLSGIGTGFTLFYAPIFFADRVGLTKTAVGIALGSASVSGIFGRIFSGSWADSPAWGRRRTLLLSCLICAGASFVLASANNFPILVVGNLLLGFGVGLYWPATEAIIADLTTAETRHEAYAITRLGDSLGLQFGVVFGGALIAITGAYRLLFVIDGISFLVFFGVIWVAISETYQPAAQPATQTPNIPTPQLKSTNTDKKTKFSDFLNNGWKIALQDRALLVYVLVNILFTTYIAQIQSTAPLYFSNFVSVKDSNQGFSTATISALFTWHIALLIVCQMPVARFLRRFSHPQSLIYSALLWAIGFTLIGITGITTTYPIAWAMLALAVLAIATVAYTPAASSLVVDLAPKTLRGVYLSINSLCWAVGYMIGPPLGGWALDLPRPFADSLWAALALSVGLTIFILQYLDRLVPQRN